MTDYITGVNSRPVFAFFDSVPDSLWLSVLESFARGVGFGMDVAVCTFPGDLDDYEDPIEGIKFSYDEEQAMLKFSEFAYLVEKKNNDYLSRQPEKTSMTQPWIEKIRRLLDSDNRDWMKPGRNVS